MISTHIRKKKKIDIEIYKNTNMEDKVGIWLDKRKAHIVEFRVNGSNVIVINSQIDSYNPKGGARGKVAYGSVDTVKEKAYLAKEITQKKQFFREISDSIPNAKDVYLFGPAQMKNDLGRYLKSNFNQINTLRIEDADSMTDNQIVAQVNKAFSKNH